MATRTFRAVRNVDIAHALASFHVVAWNAFILTLQSSPVLFVHVDEAVFSLRLVIAKTNGTSELASPSSAA